MVDKRVALKDANSRRHVWPVIFLLAFLTLVFVMLRYSSNMGEAILILGGVLLAAGIVQRITFYLRRGRPRIVTPGEFKGRL